MIQELLTVKEVMAQLRLGRTTVYRLIQSGDLPSVRIGDRVLVIQEDLKMFLESKRTAK